METPSRSASALMVVVIVALRSPPARVRSRCSAGPAVLVLQCSACSASCHASGRVSTFDALDGLLYQELITVHRFWVELIAVDLDGLPTHARLELTIDWARAEELLDSDDVEPGAVAWAASPWRIYRSLQGDDRLGADEIAVLASMPFSVHQPHGGTSRLSLDQLARERGMSTPGAVAAMFKLEEVGAIRWDRDAQAMIMPEQPPGGR